MADHNNKRQFIAPPSHHDSNPDDEEFEFFSIHEGPAEPLSYAPKA
jgi:hypothetical protein